MAGGGKTNSRKASCRWCGGVTGGSTPFVDRRGGTIGGRFPRDPGSWRRTRAEKPFEEKRRATVAVVAGRQHIGSPRRKSSSRDGRRDGNNTWGTSAAGEGSDSRAPSPEVAPESRQAKGDKVRCSERRATISAQAGHASSTDLRINAIGDHKAEKKKRAARPNGSQARKSQAERVDGSRRSREQRPRARTRR